MIINAMLRFGPIALCALGCSSISVASPPVVRASSPSNGTTTVSPTTTAAATQSSIAGTGVDLSLGTSYADGDFGAARSTSIWSTAFGARLVLDNLRLSASLPYMQIRSNGTIFTGIDSTPVVVAPGTGRRVKNEGLGDLTLGAAYTTPQPVVGFEIELSGRVKIPTATRESGLSSRKADYSVGVQATKPLGILAPFVTATYRVLGDPRGYRLRDGFAASAGSSLILSRNTVLLASYHYAQAASRLVRDAHELFVGGSREIVGTRLRLTGYATAGLSNGAASKSGGLSLSWSL